MSCTISSMAVPSSPEPAWPGSTVTLAGRSPVAWRAASESTPSDITQTLTPLPVWPAACATSALCAVTPCQVTLPALDMAPGDRLLRRSLRSFSSLGVNSRRLVVPCSRGPIVCTSARLAMSPRAETGTRAVMVRKRGNSDTSRPPRALMKAASSGETSARMTTKMVWSGATFCSANSRRLAGSSRARWGWSRPAADARVSPTSAESIFCSARLHWALSPAGACPRAPADAIARPSASASALASAPNLLLLPITISIVLI